MELTRRGRALSGCGLALVVAAYALDAPVLLWAAAAVGAVLLGSSAVFVRRLGATRRELAVAVESDPVNPVVESEGRLRLAASRPGTVLPLRIVLDRPAAAADASPVTLDVREHERASVREPVRWSTAGTFRVGPPRVVASDPMGCFLAAFEPRRDGNAAGGLDAADARTLEGSDARGPDVRGPDARNPDARNPDGRSPDGRGPDAPGDGPGDDARDGAPESGFVESGPVGSAGGEVETELLEASTTVRVTVRPRQPDTVHLGRGGTRLSAAFGEHRARRDVGAGVVPDAPQRYRPGQPVNRIDWRATARLDDVYVIEPEAETDRQTLLLVDHRASMAVGEEPATPLAFGRHAALSIVERAAADGDPVGCVAVGDAGVTEAELPGVGGRNSDAVERVLHSLEPTLPNARTGRGQSAASGPPAADATGDATGDATDEIDDAADAVTDPATDAAASGGAVATDANATATDAGATAAAAGSTGGATADAGSVAGVEPTARDFDPGFSRRAANRLAGADDDFARTLRPLLGSTTEYSHRVDSDPLAAAARTYLDRVRGGTWTVVVTDDSRPQELHETVSLARSGGDRVLVLLAPRVLYETDALADLDDALARYRHAESLRRELAGMDRVDALEIAPGERVETVLAAGGDRS